MFSTKLLVGSPSPIVLGTRNDDIFMCKAHIQFRRTQGWFIFCSLPQRLHMNHMPLYQLYIWLAFFLLRISIILISPFPFLFQVCPRTIVMSKGLKKCSNRKVLHKLKSWKPCHCTTSDKRTTAIGIWHFYWLLYKKTHEYLCQRI